MKPQPGRYTGVLKGRHGHYKGVLRSVAEELPEPEEPTVWVVYSNGFAVAVCRSYKSAWKAKQEHDPAELEPFTLEP